MTTRKQLADAQSFDSRRLVAAFLVGASRGGEPEPSRPGRAVVAGAALAALLVAGGVVASVLSPPSPGAWDGPGLVVVKETGERYLVTEKGAPLRPVVNVTSARLILGAGPTPAIVSQQVLSGRPRGDDIGILGAPQQLPDPSAFVETGWTACTANGAGLSTALARDPEVTAASGAGAVVSADGVRAWVIAEGADHRARRYRVPPIAGADNLLEAVGLPPAAQAARVPAGWLQLFPRGGRLGPASFGLGDAIGRRAPYAGDRGIAPDARIGDVATVGSTGQAFLLTAVGPTPLDPFAAAVYTTAAALDPGASGPREVGTGLLPGVSQAAPTWADAHWPAAALRPVDGPICAELAAAPGTAPYVRLGIEPHGIAWSSPAAGEHVAAAEPGTGALVRTGRSWLVDDRARAYPLQDRATLQALGLDRYRAASVPAAWLRALGSGVPLSPELARCTPASAPARASPTGQRRGSTSTPCR